MLNEGEEDEGDQFIRNSESESRYSVVKQQIIRYISTYMQVSRTGANQHQSQCIA